jgi:glutamate synthase domain-containing protein 3
MVSTSGAIKDMFLGEVRKIDELFRFIKIDGELAEIDATELKHKELNDLMRECIFKGAEKFVLKNVYGHRYIGTRLNISNPKRVQIDIYGTAGNDLGAFLNGHKIVVHGNAQDGVGNTMDDGEIIIEGRAGDVVAMSMRGGKIFIRDNVGYRTAIHMKEFENKVPVLVVGGTAQDFFGEYMAGGRVILLGLNLKENEAHKAHYIGTGMHGGIIYIRGKVEDYQLGREVGVLEPEKEDWKLIEENVRRFSDCFGFNSDDILSDKFIKLIPVSRRPYGKIYAY